jgi:hypothetical protein
MIAGSPPIREATTGVPTAALSITGKGKAS